MYRPVAKAEFKLCLILGGIKSGKSIFALELALKNFKKIALLTPLKPVDKEMKKRIEKHKRRRPKEIACFEEEIEIVKLINKMKGYDCFILDCLGIWISNLMENGLKRAQILKNVKMLTENCKECLIVVSNEVGSSLVPLTKLGRDFTDLIGEANQLLSRKADLVFYLISGIALKLKGDKDGHKLSYSTYR